MKIMIVDDSSAMRMIVKRTMRLAGFEGHEITEAEDGTMALTAIARSAPDIVLSDWNMPNMNGLELLEAIKKSGRKLIFGFVTTEGSAEMRVRASSAGAQFLISKPFSVEAFKEHLGPLIR